MRIELHVPEALALAAAARPLPPVVSAVRGDGATVEVDLDLREIPGLHGAQRLAARLAGTATLTARLTELTDGVATLALDVAVRGLPVDTVVGLLAERLTPVIEAQGLPPGAVVLTRGQLGLTATVQVQRLLEQHVRGLRPTSVVLSDGRIHAEVEVGEVSLR
jgi:hypothetical protein